MMGRKNLEKKKTSQFHPQTENNVSVLCNVDV